MNAYDGVPSSWSGARPAVGKSGSSSFPRKASLLCCVAFPLPCEDNPGKLGSVGFVANLFVIPATWNLLRLPSRNGRICPGKWTSIAFFVGRASAKCHGEAAARTSQDRKGVKPARRSLSLAEARQRNPKTLNLRPCRRLDKGALLGCPHSGGSVELAKSFPPACLDFFLWDVVHLWESACGRADVAPVRPGIHHHAEKKRWAARYG